MAGSPVTGSSTSTLRCSSDGWCSSFRRRRSSWPGESISTAASGAGLAYGVLVLLVGLMISVAAPAVRVRAGQLSVETASRVVVYNVWDIVVFGAFFVAAAALRRHPELHRRLILSATVALLGAAVGRPLRSASLSYFLVWLSPLFASMAVDLATSKRLHFVSLLSLAVFAMTFYKVQIVALSPSAQRAGTVLITPLL